MENMVIEIKNLSKNYGKHQVINDMNLSIPEGRIVGIIGSNGAGKSTFLNTILGLSSYKGSISVLGKNPLAERSALMQDICFIADVATLPKWMKVSQVIDFVENIHPKFDRRKALDYLSRTEVPLDRKVKKLSKGMTVQAHLAIVMSIDAKLLILDEPTLGLDVIFRKEFYRTLLEEYFDEKRTILITTHQIEEVEHILSDVIFIKKGHITLYSDIETLDKQFVELLVDSGKEEQAKLLGPISSRKTFGKDINVYRNNDIENLKNLGEVRRLGLADIFVACVKDTGIQADSIRGEKK